MDTAYLIERLLAFGENAGLIKKNDKIIARNTLLDLFGLAEPYSGEVSEKSPSLVTEILDALVEAAGQQGLFDKESATLAVNFEARIMGALMPRQSEIEAEFSRLKAEKGIKAATDYFYDLCIKCNYIRTAQIAKNIKWEADTKYGKMEITINLTKPEKDPKTIALERLAPAAGYPKCMLCIDNIGYAGRINFPARQNHRAVPIEICSQPWFLQYSPYVYYNEHCIIFSEKHEPMTVSPLSMEQLFSFIDQFPHYTCGSNADLPIVGGSILSHTHFQGGNYVFPMHRAKAVKQLKSEKYKSLNLEILHWPVSTLRVRTKDKKEALAFGTEFLAAWRNYSDESADVLAFSGDIPHNTVTPILHIENGEYVFDLVPRNNRTSAEHPDGIFHPHKEIHHIKKENIGLIEVMGLAILPSRLKEQAALIENALQGIQSTDDAKAKAPEHTQWIDYLAAKYGTELSAQKASEAVRAEIGAKFESCLEHAGVFKQTAEGIDAFTRFLKALNVK